MDPGQNQQEGGDGGDDGGGGACGHEGGGAACTRHAYGCRMGSPRHRGVSPILLFEMADSGWRVMAWPKALEKCSSTTDPMSPWK